MDGSSPQYVTLDIHVSEPLIGVRQHSCKRNADPVDEARSFCEAHDVGGLKDIFTVLVHEERQGEPSKRIVCSFAGFKEHQQLRLEDGSRLVEDILGHIKSGTRSLAESTNHVSEVLGWVRSLLVNASVEHVELNRWFNDEALKRGGFSCALTSFVAIHKLKDMSAVEALIDSLLGCIVHWMQCTDTRRHLEDNREFINTDLCDALLATLFGQRVALFHSAACTFSGDAKRSAFLFLLYMLQESPESRTIFNLCCTEKGSTSQTYYHLLAAAAANANAPEHSYAQMLLNVITSFPEMREMHKQDSVNSELLRELGLRSSEAVTKENQKLLLHCCTAATISAEMAKSNSRSSSMEEIEVLKKKNNALIRRKQKVENDLRKLHRATCKMVEFVDVNETFVNQSLKAVARFGWDSVKWEKGYTALHFIAECIDNPDLLELFALLATDVNCRDRRGYRPLDYARKENRQSNVHVLEKLRERAKRDGLAEERLTRVTTSVHYGVTLPEDLTPTLQIGMEAALRLGWKEIEWPRGYTALHLAAASGNLPAVKILVEQVTGVWADVNRVDDAGKRAIDYATENKHIDVAHYLENYGKPDNGAARGDEQKLEREDANAVLETLCHSASKPLFRECETEIPPEIVPSMQQICVDVAHGRTPCAPNDLPLHAAVKAGDAAAITFLRSQGITDMPDAEGKTANEYAQEAASGACVAALNEEIKVPDRSRVKSGLSSSSSGTQVATLKRELAQAREQLQSYKKDLMSAKYEEEVLVSRQLRAKVTNLTKQLETGQNGALVGPLTPEQVDSFDEQLRAFGPEAFRAKLSESKLSGGLSLSLDDAANALEQMLCVKAEREKKMPRRALCPKCRGSMDISEASQGAQENTTPDEEGVAEPGFEKGKGKPARPVGKVAKASRALELLFEKGKPGKPSVGDEGDGGNEAGETEDGAPGDNPVAKLFAKGKAGKPTGPPVPSKVGKATSALELLFGKGKSGKSSVGDEGNGVNEAGETDDGASGSSPLAQLFGKGKAGKPSGPALPGKLGKPGPGSPLEALFGKGKPGKPNMKGKPGMEDGDADLGDFRPPKPMKPLWWQKQKLKHIQTEGTVWHDSATRKYTEMIFALLQREFQDEFLTRFAKEDPRRAEAPKPNEEPVKKVVVQALRIITDPQLLVGREAAVKVLPSPQIVAKAVLDLDDVVLTTSLLEVVKNNCCPTCEQAEHMNVLRKENPLTPWALPEQYMAELICVPMYQHRIESWLFLRTYQEQAKYCDAALDGFMEVVQCMRESQVLPLFLALALACGNYLNGGTVRGNAEAFDFETLAKLVTVKDNDKKKNLISFMIEVFLGKLEKDTPVFADEAAAFGRDLGTMLSNMRRRIQREKDGTEKLEKSIRYNIEDFDQVIKALHEECDMRFDIVQTILLNIEDPADPLRTVLLPEFQHAKKVVGDLVAKKTLCQTKFAELREYFNVPVTTTSAELVTMWDNLLIPGDLIINKTDILKQKYMKPMFCSDRLIDKEAMEILWELKRPGGERKRRRARRSQQSRAQALAHRKSKLGIIRDGKSDKRSRVSMRKSLVGNRMSITTVAEEAGEEVARSMRASAVSVTSNKEDVSPVAP